MAVGSLCYIHIYESSPKVRQVTADLNLGVGLPEACYHEVGDVAALASKLETIINQPLQRIDYDMSKYNWDTIAGQVNDIYKTLA